MKRCKGFYISVILCFIILTVNFAMSLAEQIDYEKRKNSGNERWKQVEATINGIDKRVKELEKNARCN